MSENHPIVILNRVVRVENETLLTLCFELTDGEHSEKRTLVIPESLYFELGLKKGSVISAELFERLEEEAKSTAAYRRGIGILAYGANSARSLERKLVRKGHDPESSKRAAEKLAENGFINESADAVRAAEACLRKLWGEKRIMAYLYEKGYRDEALRAAKERLADVDFTKNCAEYIKKKYRNFPTDKKEAEKAIAALIRYGYTLSQIKSSL